MSDLTEKIKRMAEYLDEESIARALQVNIEVVRGILTGGLTKHVAEDPVSKTNIITFQKTAFRQKIISVCRTRGGIGSSLVALNLADLIANHVNVLLVDTCALIVRRLVASDLLDMMNLEPYYLENYDEAPEIAALGESLHYLPYPLPNKAIPFNDLINHVRQSYDAVVFDLPILEEKTKEVIAACNNNLILFSGGEAEKQRLLLYKQYFPDGLNKILVFNDIGWPIGKQNCEVIREQLAIDTKGTVYLGQDEKLKQGVIATP